MCYATRGLMASVQGGVAVVGETDIFVGRRKGRGIVSVFSSSARRRLLRFCAASMAQYTTLLTVTLPHIETDGRVFKERLDRLLKYLRAAAADNFPGQVWSALWVLEFQKRGAVHAHLLLTHPIDMVRIRERWVALWASRIAEIFPATAAEVLDKMGRASTFIETIRDRGHALSYCGKYASKTASKSVICGRDFGRWWGVRGERSVEERDVLQAWPLPPDPAERNRLLDGFWGRVTSLVKDLSVLGVRAFRWVRGIGFVFYQGGDDESWRVFISALREVAASYGLVPPSDADRERRFVAGVVHG